MFRGFLDTGSPEGKHSFVRPFVVAGRHAPCLTLTIELQKHAEELAKHPAAWMPWNYRQTLQPAGGSKDPAA